MNILQVHSTDIIGGVFNGYHLQKSLNELGYSSKQIVKNKRSSDENVVQISKFRYAEFKLTELEEQLSLENMLSVWGYQVADSKEFKEADIVHYHMTHHFLLSVMQLSDLSKKKPSVWTIHDFWPMTGHCVYPLECEKWKTGCKACDHLDYYFPLKEDRANELWSIKKKAYQNMDVDIIVSNLYMKQTLDQSGLFEGKNVHVIPFGIETEKYSNVVQSSIKNKFRISVTKIVIGLRATDYIIKGCSYIWRALETIASPEKYVILAVNEGNIPDVIINKFETRHFGTITSEKEMIDFYGACDIFLMPSLMETFGLMAIEAMAAGTVVIAFEKTIVAKNIQAPEVGIAVEYKNAEALSKAITYLADNPIELAIRSEKSRLVANEFFNYKKYVKKHIEVYKEILNKTDVSMCRE